MSKIRDFYLKHLQRSMAKKERADLSGSAIVFAPHPDDETLGCGGTIIRKKAAGASVNIVFATEGARSHGKFMPASELKEIRRREAIAAAQALGVSAEEVSFLGFEDGQLKARFEEVRDRLFTLIAKHKPDEIYVTHHQDSHTDHATLYWAAAMAATQPMSSAPTIYAYPVWYWRHWPWTQLAGNGKKETLAIVRATLDRKLGAHAFSEFQHPVYVADVLPQKRVALACHKSQMQRFDDNPDWPILSDVSDGDFLDCFFQPYEMFHQLSVRP